MSQPTTVAAAHHHAPPQGFLRKHVFSLDHKVIGKQYLDLALVAVCTGMVLSWLMRFHLAWPETPIPGLGTLSPSGAAGGVITPEYYLALMTMHGTIMVFFVLTTAPFAGFGNYFLPIQVGAEDMAFPRINMTSFWVTLVAFLVLVAAFFVGDGPPLSGWTAYAPLSAVGKDAGPGQGGGHVLLHSRAARDQRPPAAPCGGIPALVAAPVLVLRPPGGIHRDPARVRHHLAHSPGVCPEAALGTTGPDRLSGRDRLPE